jgi:hypothetical protein
MVKSRTSAIVSVALVFLSGALVGAVGHRLYVVETASAPPVAQAHPPDRPPRPTPEEVRKHRIEEMRTVVKLDDQQVKELEQIYDHTREQFDEIHKRLDAEGRGVAEKQTEAIRAILRPDQVPLFDQLHAKHEADHKARQKDNGERPGR